MSTGSPDSASRDRNPDTQSPTPASGTPRWQQIPIAPLTLTIVYLACALFPSVRANPKLIWTFVGVGSVLCAWTIILWVFAKRLGRSFRIEFNPVKSHYVQASVQSCILIYWGWYARAVYAELPLILAQVLFLYALEALLSWSRGRTWRLGFGPLPIILSTNLLLWFRDDWFYLQFLMVTVGILAKQFITWNRDGKRTHIFNPSAFGQFLFALALIVTGTTKQLTWGKEIAATFETPHMLVVIFCMGLIVQYLFEVTLMTLAAAATLCVVNLAYTRITGTYFFVNTNIAAPIFLGIHLLVTDPATSPRTNTGRVIFGSLYALGYCALFRILDMYEVPVFWDKLLPVPLLNAIVPLIDHVAKSGIVGKFNRLWEGSLPSRKMNLVHMGCWIALFSTWVATGFVEGPHTGNSIPFWKKALADGKPYAGPSLVMAVGSQAVGESSGAAFNELGLICIEGKIAKTNHAEAARYFARACELGNIDGCANLASQYLYLHERTSDDDVSRALSRLELECGQSGDWEACILVGSAYETGRGRRPDKLHAIQLYKKCGRGNLYACKGLARIALSDDSPPCDLSDVAEVLDKAAETGDAESCWYLAYMYRAGNGVQHDEQRARALMEKACRLGSEEACRALNQLNLPLFSKPRMAVPGWSTAFPIKQ